MRVLFAVFPAIAHVQPIVPLAWALQNAGHEVRVAIHPDATHLVTDAGLPAVPLGARHKLAGVVEFNSNYDRLDTLDDGLSLDSEDGRRWEAQWEMMRNVLSVYNPVLPDLVDLTRRWKPDLVVWDPFCVAAGVAAAVGGAAHARFLWGRDNVAWLRAKSLEHQAAQGLAPEDDPLSAMMSGLLAPYGLKYEEEHLLGQWTIDPMPAGLRLPLDLPYIGVRRIPYNGAAALPAWVHEPPARPRVCLTLGVGGRGRQLFRESGTSFARVVEAIAGLDVELVATVGAGERDSLGEVPDNVRLVDYLPLSQLLPTCSAIIHHGGGGTFAASVASRVPQLVTPMPFWGEAATARYVQDSGAGLVLTHDEFTPEALRTALSRLLDEPSFQDGAASLHREMRDTPSPADLVPVLEELTARHRG
ncbi:activator-dependent family glycosyltransferase [Streptomyces sp. RerS4]|uniref:activator-dependent family glycosyltransferase n=1 Tax=Streptomyces sp. RerS4 TaxID=2942449 RepID=UPI00201C73EA|nr:activator-dependent family glycosyltransferase [Streptomyces sp. RerS4]UQX05463.1 activator-dependent family glycosyltransferase [Streptomyces sp. RerS4]